MKKKEKRYGLLKGIILFIVIAIILTWLIPNGAFNTEFVSEDALVRVGLNDIAWIIYYGLYFSIDKIMILLVIGGLYGILGKIRAYDDLVTGIAGKIKNKKLAVVIFSVIIALLTSILTQTFVVLIFIPFIVAILNRMKLDKMTILATTFGSILVGILGATYGTEGLVYLAQYFTPADGAIHNTIKNLILVRAGILVIGLVLFNFFTISHMKKVTKDAEGAEMFPIEVGEKTKSTKKGGALPIVILGVITLVLVILGYIGWNNNFNIDAFDKFNKTVTEVSIGDDFFIFKDLLGSKMGAFGTWDLFAITSILLLFTIIIGLCYRMKLDDFFDNFIEGAKRVLKPIACVFGAFTLLVVVYMSPYLATIINKLLSLTDGFNLATMFISLTIANIFHTDLGYSGYILGTYLTTEYADYAKPIFVMFTSLYGFVQMFIPTSIILGVGLTSLKVKYSEWLKYVWKFLVGMLVCLLVIFILIAFI